jgi:hypothetical protein
VLEREAYFYDDNNDDNKSHNNGRFSEVPSSHNNTRLVVLNGQ